MDFVACNDYILVKRDEIEDKVSPGGIFMPEKTQEPPCTCEIIEIGPKVELKIKKGDKAVVSLFGGTNIKLDEEEYTVIKEEDIFGVLK